MNMVETLSSTVRKHNFHLVDVTQSKDAFMKSNYSDLRLPHRLLRRYLSDYGFRGTALNAEVQRIVAGPLEHLKPECGVWYSFPYGWDQRQFTREMRRIFKGRGQRKMLIMDEAWNFF